MESRSFYNIFHQEKYKTQRLLQSQRLEYRIRGYSSRENIH